MKVKITKEDKKKCMLFANLASKYHANFKRNDIQKKENIYIGKLGEVGFKKIFTEKISDINFEIKEEHDGGIDFFFIDSEMTIDVKTIDKEYKKRVYVKTKFQADVYALMYYNIEDNTATLLGFVKKELLNKNLVHDEKNNCYYVNKSLFKINKD